MADGPPAAPPDLGWLAWLAAAGAAVGVVMDRLAGWWKTRAEVSKLRAEQEVAATNSEKLYEELQANRLTHLTAWIAASEQREALKDQKLLSLEADLKEERDHMERFRSAVFEFIGEIKAVIPLAPDAVQKLLQGALDRLRTNEAWDKTRREEGR